MENGIDPRIVHLGRQAMTVGRQVLVVGVSPGDLGKWHKVDDHRLVVWLATDFKNSIRSVPRGVALVVMTKLRSHGLTKRIQRGMPQDAVMYSRPFSPGELKTFIEEIYVPLPPKVTSSTPEFVINTPSILSVPTVPAKVEVVSPVQTEEVTAKAVPEMAPQQEVKVEKGQTAAFVRENVNVNAKPATEIRRMMDLASEKGLTVKESTVASLFFKLKKDANPAGEVPQGIKSKSNNSRSRVDAVKQLVDFCHGAELAGVTVLEILEENKRLHAEVETLKAELKGKKKAIKDALAQLV